MTRAAPNAWCEADTARLRPGSRAACLGASVTASQPLQFASRSFELLGGNGRAALASARGTGRAAYTKNVRETEVNLRRPMRVVMHVRSVHHTLPILTSEGWCRQQEPELSLAKKIDLDLFIVETPRGDYILEWSAPTCQQSGQVPHASIRKALHHARELFGVSNDSWRKGDLYKADDQDRFRPQMTEPAQLGDLWPYFEWSAPETSHLIDLFRGELSHRRRKYEERMDQYGSYDPDERTINRDWCRELSFILRRWSALLEMPADDIPGYRKAVRMNVWNEALIDIDPIVDTVAKNLGSRYASTGVLFRPLCLEQADREIMNWLAAHPRDVDRLHHRTFEAIVAEVVREAGWAVELTKRTRDGGYDLLCLGNNLSDVPVKLIVETKLYDLRRAVGLPMVDRLMGAAARTRAHQVVLVTNSRFSRDAWKLWEERVNRDLMLIDREALFAWLADGKANL